MNPLELEFAADSLIFFMRHNGIALMIAAPALIALIILPSDWRK